MYAAVFIAAGYFLAVFAVMAVTGVVIWWRGRGKFGRDRYYE